MDQRNILFKTYRKDIWSKFLKGLSQYDLIQSNDKIAVCISGGKDSMLLALCFKLLQPISDIPFEVEYIVMDPGYLPHHRQQIVDNAKELDIPITIYDSSIFEVVDNLEKKPCYLCARMRRGHLYTFAKERGCNKIALGHHYDDVIETTLMNMFYGGQMGTMLPRLHATNFENMELIRPFYLVREKHIINWMRYSDLSFLNCACTFTAKEEYQNTSKRKEIKEFIQTMAKNNPFFEANIFRSTENVNLHKLISYHDDNSKTHFLDQFNIVK